MFINYFQLFVGYFKLYPDAIRLVLYQDDVETGNALSSRAGKNKISNFAFKIQNFPVRFNSSPKTIFPLIFALSQLVKRHGCNKIIEPLVTDLKALEAGVTVKYSTETFTIRAVVIMFVGDTLALHEVFGLLGPSAKYFCRICTVPRPTFNEDPGKRFPLRTIDWYDSNLEAVQSGQIQPSECGLKQTGCVLNCLEQYHIIKNWALDPMHDLGEGVIPSTIQLVLSKYRSMDLGFTAEFINHRISTFNYGYEDRKNRPMSNFTPQMLTKPEIYKIRQTASQSFLLLLSFPFLFVHKIPKDCQLMSMIGHLINITRIVLSPVVSENMLLWLNEHTRLFTDLFSENFDKRINKLHHLQHYEQCIRHIGSTIQSNCLPFEQKNKPIKRQAANCKNFRNLSKSLADRQCFATVIDLLDNPFCDKITYKPNISVKKEDMLCCAYIEDPNINPLLQKSIVLNGVEFRKNLIVAFKIHANKYFPSYGIILEIVDVTGKVLLLLRCCNTLGYDEAFQAYEVEESEHERFLPLDEVFQHATFSFWTPHNSSTKFISRRWYNQDY